MKKIVAWVALIFFQHVIASIEWVKPLQLYNHRRFDIGAKLIYAKYHTWKTQASWPTEVFLAHHLAWNQLKEVDKEKKQKYSKVGAEEFLKAFNTVLNTIKKAGFDRSKKAVPLGKNYITDGAHRVSACIQHNKLIAIKHVAGGKKDGPTYEKFLERKLEQAYIDAMALEYMYRHENTFCAVLFPCIHHTQKTLELIKQTLTAYGNIVYLKKIEFSECGAQNLMALLYKNKKLNPLSPARFTYKNKHNLYSVYAILFEADNLQIMQAAKYAVRDLFNLGHNPIHATDTYDETYEAATTLFHNQTIKMLNTSRDFLFLPENKIILSLKEKLISKKIPLDACGIDLISKQFYCFRPFAQKANTLLTQGIKYSEDLNEKIENAIADPKNYVYKYGCKIFLNNN